MYNAESEDDKMQCPYDASHNVIRKHYQKHLLKCKKNHPEIGIAKCPFNAIHLMPEQDLLNHLTICPDRKLVTHYQGPLMDGNVDEDVKRVHIDDEEIWDEENNSVPDFTPTVFSPLQVKREK